MTQIPAGWYPQPDGTQRYWDGNGWTEQVAPTAPPQAAAAQPQSAPVQPGNPPVPGAGPSPATPEPSARPWYKKKRVLIPAAALILIVGASAAAGGNRDQSQPASAPAASVTAAAPSQEPSDASDDATTDATAEPTEEGDAPAAPNAYDEAYGTFSRITKNGRGDSIVKLPAGASAGLVTLTHNGSSNFAVYVLDSHNKSNGDLLVNEIGDYSGTTAYGFSFDDDSKKLKITADGRWTLKIAPISTAPEFGAKESGKGDKVMLYNGGAADYKVIHKGRSNFVVLQETGGFPNLAVNEIGRYSGVVPIEEGPSVVIVKADGAWTAVRT
ncbi:MAG: DUF2510 domain-containing protein [Propionibacteriaceae bacterium]|nr:DUF2510 domain-containing protein [Propionibacteriaceae bacterium]